MKEIICKNCETKLTNDISVCPKCGGKNKFIKINISETIKVTEGLGIRQKAKGFKKFMTEFISGHKDSGDAEKHPEGVIEERIIDKKNKTYYHKVTDKKTGKVTHLEEESLLEHKK